MATRHRSFVAIFYPESAPENFRELIAGWQVPALLILHDKDDKKPHYHLMLLFSSVKTLVQVHKLTDQLGSKELQPSYDVHGSARYLAHLDHPDKYQYGTGAIEAFSGADVAALTAPVSDPTAEILAFVREQGFTEYASLVDYCHDQRIEWLKEVKGHPFFWGFYFTSCRMQRHYGGRL